MRPKIAIILSIGMLLVVSDVFVQKAFIGSQLSSAAFFVGIIIVVFSVVAHRETLAAQNPKKDADSSGGCAQVLLMSAGVFFIVFWGLCGGLIFSTENMAQSMGSIVILLTVLSIIKIKSLSVDLLNEKSEDKTASTVPTLLPSVLAMVLVFIGVLFLMPLHFKYFALPVYQGSVICGFPSYPNNFLPEGNYTLAEVYGAFLQQNSFGTILNLSFKKAISFFTLTRPYYSLSHNLINSFYYLFILGGLLGIYNLIKTKANTLFVIYFASILSASLLIVMLIYNEWSERFLVPLLPFFILATLMYLSKFKAKRAI